MFGNATLQGWKPGAGEKVESAVHAVRSWVASRLDAAPSHCLTLNSGISMLMLRPSPTSADLAEIAKSADRVKSKPIRDSIGSPIPDQTTKRPARPPGVRLLAPALNRLHDPTLRNSARSRLRPRADLHPRSGSVPSRRRPRDPACRCATYTGCRTRCGRCRPSRS